MKLQEVRAIANRRGVAPRLMKKAELIRALQRDEGNNDCFGTVPSTECGEHECLWREDCLKESKTGLSS
jgi:hypothetical protein